jgi:hypothetical protein
MGLLGTTFIQRPLEDSVSEAPFIVRGKIGMSYADWSKTEKVRRIYTFTELQGAEAIKGELKTSTLIFRELGGEKDGVGLEIPGTAKFRSGEEVVVFLDKAEKSEFYNIRGLMMGKLNLSRDADGNEVLEGPAVAYDRSWTMEKLKRVIAEQKSGITPLQQVPASQRNDRIVSDDEISGHANPTETGTPAPQNSENSPDARDEDSSRKNYGIGIGLIAAFFAVRFLRKARQKRS